MEVQYELKEKNAELRIINGVCVHCLVHHCLLSQMFLVFPGVTASLEGICLQTSSGRGSQPLGSNA